MTLTTEGGLVLSRTDAVRFGTLKSYPVGFIAATANLCQGVNVASFPSGIVGAEPCCQRGESFLECPAGIDTQRSVVGVLDVRVATDRCFVADSNCAEDCILVGDPDS